MLSEDVEENPGTLALTALWVLVYGLMLALQWLHPLPGVVGPRFEPLPISPITSHRFGDMTWLDVRRGEPWRLVTATFIHFGLIHLVLNGLALVNLGRLVEPWYRTGPFFAVCLLIGGLGNLVGGALRQLVGIARPWLASLAVAWHWPDRIERFLHGNPAVPVSIHTGGGSTILLGLLALGAVVGWRSRTRIGAHLQKQMLILLALTAVLGAVMYNLVDNFGHLGGAIVGALIGFGDPTLLRLSDRKWFRVLSWVFVALVSISCLVLAVRDDRIETNFQSRYLEIATREQTDDQTRIVLERLFALYARMVAREANLRELDAIALGDLLRQGPSLGPPAKADLEQLARDRKELDILLVWLATNRLDLWGEPVAADLSRLRVLGRSALENPPAFDQVYDFVVSWKSAIRTVATDLALTRVKKSELEKPGVQPR